MQLLVSEDALVARFAFPDQRRFIPSGAVKVPIEAVFRDIELAADEPLCERCFPVQDFFPRLLPAEFARFPGPELVRVAE